jgi:hypothetical protein
VEPDKWFLRFMWRNIQEIARKPLAKKARDGASFV